MKDPSQGPMSGDHHKGVCIILFRGDYDQCMRVRKYIKNEMIEVYDGHGR